MAAYARDGFVLLDDSLSPAEAATLATIMRDVETPTSAYAARIRHHEWVVSRGGERERVLARCEDIMHHPEWVDLLEQKLTPIASALLGTPATLHKEKLHPKYPGAAGFRAHQDSAAYAVAERQTIGGVIEQRLNTPSGQRRPSSR